MIEQCAYNFRKGNGPDYMIPMAHRTLYMPELDDPAALYPPIL